MMIQKLHDWIVSFPILRSYLVARQFVKFGIIGVINTFVDFMSYVFLTRTFDFFRDHFLLANAAAFLIAVTGAFFLNRKWTFRDSSESWHSKFAKFFLVYCVGFALNQSMLALTVLYFGLHDILGKIAALCANFMWNFLLTRYWAFSHVLRENFVGSTLPRNVDNKNGSSDSKC